MTPSSHTMSECAAEMDKEREIPPAKGREREEESVIKRRCIIDEKDVDEAYKSLALGWTRQ